MTPIVPPKEGNLNGTKGEGGGAMGMVAHRTAEMRMGMSWLELRSAERRAGMHGNCFSGSKATPAGH